jgi:DNA-directed RNA polymerase specialized sigma24 family protein
LKYLKENDRQLVEAAYFRGESRDQLAMRFGAPLNTIKTWLRRALLDLQARCAENATSPRHPTSGFCDCDQSFHQ